MEKFFSTLEQNYVKYGDHYIAIIVDIDGIIWFNANDIASALGYMNPRKTIEKRIRKQEKYNSKILNMKETFIIIQRQYI